MQKFQTASVKKGDEVSCDVKTEVEIGNVEAEFKLDTKSKLYFKAVYEDLAPGLKLALTGIVPDSKATKAELTYKQELLHVNATVGLVTQPVFEGALSVGTKGVVVGAELGYDTATNSATKYNLGVAYSESDFAASLLIADKLDTLKAAYFQKVKDNVEVAVEAAHKLSKSDTTFTAGASFELDPLTEAKLRFNNRGTVAALLQHEFRPKSKVTIAGEVDSKALDKSGKVGLAIALKLSVRWINKPQHSVVICFHRQAADFPMTRQKGQPEGGSAQRVSGNPYVERVVQVAVGAALGETRGGAGDAATDKRRLRKKLASAGVRITIAGDNDFYSHRHTLQRMGLPLSASSLARIPSFAPIVSNPSSAAPDTSAPPVTTAAPDALAPASTSAVAASAAAAAAAEATRGHVPEVAKTGLGSSAAMTAAVSAALLRFLGVLGGTGSGAPDEVCQERPMGSGAEEGSQEEAVGSEGTVGREEVVHRVAQVAHCLAQGKAGSGFDVASGVFGSMCYQRFNPAVMHSLMVGALVLGAAVLRCAMMGAEAAMTVSSVSATLRSPLWDHTIAPLHLPRGLLLVLGEPGTGGTATPSMLSAVMKWRRQSPDEAEPIWEGLKEANAAVAAALTPVPARTHPSRRLLHHSEPPAARASHCSNPMRHLLSAMGSAAATPIEPPQQTALLDATMQQPGVVMAGVPGAGGFDSVFAVVVGEEAVRRLDGVWAGPVTCDKAVASPLLGLLVGLWLDHEGVSVAVEVEGRLIGERREVVHLPLVLVHPPQRIHRACPPTPPTFTPIRRP
ncbi:unnamed protein product [Closterium sp. Naga37s-1]|nr:unnamed protein product [Closterium sp. Naga37s-1]